jgi:hypothetical protein
MKREKRYYYPKVKKIYPIIFWRECKKCGKEFKRETGFSIVDIFANDELRINFLCGDCAVDFDGAYEIAINEKYPPKPEINPSARKQSVRY